MQVQVKVYDANGVESKLRICDNVNKTDLSEFSIRGNLGGTAELSSDKKNWDYYPADNTKDYGSEETATATLGGERQDMCPDSKLEIRYR